MTTIKFDDNFSKNCDELMKDLPKPTTQVEEIVWHKYPKLVPNNSVVNAYIVDFVFPEGVKDKEIAQYYGDEFVSCEIALDECEIIAWAELPKGWKE